MCRPHPNYNIKFYKLTLNRLRIYDDMGYLINKYPPMSLVEQPAESIDATAATGKETSISDQALEALSMKESLEELSTKGSV